MTTDNAPIRRLVHWNRFWFTVALLYTLISGANYFMQRIISATSRLELNWGTDEHGERALIFSSAQGGPFVVTHLVTQEGDAGIDTAVAAIAQLPQPLFVRGPKACTYIPAHELARLTWIKSDAQRTVAPKPNEPVQALYYETRKVTTTP